MKPAAWVGLIVIISALAFGANAFVSNLTPYVTFEQARTAKSTVQVMGALDKTSVVSDARALRFTLLSKEGGDRLPVIFTAAKPANFLEATEVTAIGTFDPQTQTFQAKNLLVKCPTKYQGTEGKSEVKEYSAR